MEFLKYIIYAAMIAEVVILIMPSGNMKRYVKLSAGVLITLMLLSPIASCDSASFLNGEENIEEEFDDYDNENENISAGKIITDVYNDLLENTN